MRYSIGDVSRSLGLTPAALHYFEKEGVIQPVKGNASRRTYTTCDFIRLVSYKKYRQMEMPLKEIAMQFSADGDDYESIERKVAKLIEEAEQTAQRYRQLAEDTAWFREHIHSGIEGLNRITFATMPECAVLRVGDGCISTERGEQQRVAEWLERMPSSRVSVFSDESGNASFGYCMRRNRAEETGLIGSATSVMGGKTCIRTFVKVSKALYDDPELAFQPAKKYLADHGFTQDGEAAGVILCVHCHEEELDSLLEIYVPFL